MTRVSDDSGFDDLEELRKRFEEFRNQHELRTRLPESYGGLLRRSRNGVA